MRMHVRCPESFVFARLYLPLLPFFVFFAPSRFNRFRPPVRRVRMPGIGE